jgi:hypothetical protein
MVKVVVTAEPTCLPLASSWGKAVALTVWVPYLRKPQVVKLVAVLPHKVYQNLFSTLVYTVDLPA